MCVERTMLYNQIYRNPELFNQSRKEYTDQTVPEVLRALPYVQQVLSEIYQQLYQSHIYILKYKLLLTVFNKSRTAEGDGYRMQSHSRYKTTQTSPPITRQLSKSKSLTQMTLQTTDTTPYSQNIHSNRNHIHTRKY